MVFKISSIDINIDIDEIVNKILEVIAEDCNGAICDCFEGLDEADDFFYYNEKEIDKMEKHVRELITKKLLED
jgi:hypothetical protein